MWAQDWANIYDLVAPYPEVTSPDVTSSLSRANYSVARMLREAESFFTSLGLEPMTDEFWTRSMFVRPRDGRQVTCHASASDMFAQSDFRYNISLSLSSSLSLSPRDMPRPFSGRSTLGPGGRGVQPPPKKNHG